MIPQRTAPIAPGRGPLAPALVPLLAGLLALCLYGCTLAPGLTWAHSSADGGDLLAAALVHGVPHPTGYPTYQVLLRAAIALFPGEPARAGNWLSALSAALATALLADLGRRVLGGMGREPAVAQQQPGLAAGLAALAWAASPAVWGQATVTEVYALNALGAVALLWLAWRWAAARAAGGSGLAWLAALGLALGLGLGNHVSLLLMLPALIAWGWSAGGNLGGRANLRLAFGLGGLLFAAAFLLGLAVYACLPLAAAGRPPVNWGDPVTPARLWSVATGRLYAGLLFGLPLAELPARLLGWASEALRQFGGPWGFLLALFGLWRLDAGRPGAAWHAWWRVTLLVALAYTFAGISYNTSDSFVYLLPAWAALTPALAAGIAWILERIARRRAGGRAGGGLAAIAVALLALLLVGASIAANWRTHDLRGDTAAAAWVAAALDEAAPGAVIVSAGDRATFALWYAVYGTGQRPDVALLNANLLGYDWYRATLRETHADVFRGLPEPPPPLEELLPALAAERPLYRADELGLDLPGLREAPGGVLVRYHRTP